MERCENLTGKIFGRLVVYKRAPNGATNRIAHWHCMCRCGTSKVIRADRLLAGKTKSCGCLYRENGKKRTAEADARRAAEGITAAEQRARRTKEYNAEKREEYLAAGDAEKNGTVLGVQKATRRYRVYGVGSQDYAQMLAAQGGVCAICGMRPAGKDLAVDHNHVTGAVRGLLCGG